MPTLKTRWRSLYVESTWKFTRKLSIINKLLIILTKRDSKYWILLTLKGYVRRRVLRNAIIQRTYITSMAKPSLLTCRTKFSPLWITARTLRIVSSFWTNLLEEVPIIGWWTNGTESSSCIWWVVNLSCQLIMQLYPVPRTTQLCVRRIATTWNKTIYLHWRRRDWDTLRRLYSMQWRSTLPMRSSNS